MLPRTTDNFRLASKTRVEVGGELSRSGRVYAHQLGASVNPM
ncbi:hypothetical protein AB0J83_17050 [Actinoplanes sp. NPDC049596]